MLSAVFYGLTGWDVNITEQQMNDFDLIEEAYRHAGIAPGRAQNHRTYLKRIAAALTDHGSNAAFFRVICRALELGGGLKEPALGDAVPEFGRVLASQMCARAVALTTWCDAAKDFVQAAHGVRVYTPPPG